MTNDYVDGDDLLDLGAERLSVREDQVDADLEAQVRDPADHRLGAALARLAGDVQVVRAHEPPAERRHRPEEAHHEVVGRAVVEFERRADLFDEAVALARLASVQPTDPSDILFTSGTTGRPKGVVMSHAQTTRHFDDWCDYAGLRPGDRYLIVNPFFHMFGYKAGWLAGLMRGATIYPVPVFDVPTVLSLVERERITVLPGAPTIYRTILDHPDRARHDLGSLRVAVTGAGGNGVFRVTAFEEALKKRFAPKALEGIHASADGLNSDLHGSAEYRAHLIGVLAQRAVAAANGANGISILVPCHRVIGSNGELVGYAGGLPAKQKLLQLEGAAQRSLVLDLFSASAGP